MGCVVATPQDSGICPVEYKKYRDQTLWNATIKVYHLQIEESVHSTRKPHEQNHALQIFFLKLFYFILFEELPQ